MAEEYKPQKTESQATTARISYVTTSKPYLYPTNWVSVVLIIIGIIGMVGCVILGAATASAPDTLSDGTVLPTSHFVWQVALPYWVGGLVSGFAFIGFGEIINILHKVRIRLDVNAERNQNGGWG